MSPKPPTDPNPPADPTPGTATPPELGAAPASPEPGAAPDEPQKTPHQLKMERLRAEVAAEQAGETPPPEGDETPPEEPPAAEGDLELPEGWSRTESGKLKRPDGTFASHAEIQAIEAGEDPAAAAAAAPASEEGDGEFLVAKLPGRRPDDEEFELRLPREALEAAGVDVDDLGERFAQLRNGYARRQEVALVQEENRADRAELDAIYGAMKADPSAFLVTQLDPKLRTRVAADLLLSLEDDAFQAVLERADRWARDPGTRRVERTEAENERLRAERDQRARQETARADQDLAKDIGREILGLIPDDMDDGRADRFWTVAVSELQKHIKRHELTSLDPKKVPQVLADLGVLDDYGLSASAAGNATVDRAAGNGARPRGSAQKPPARPTGEDARTRMERRRSAAQAPAGAGSAALEGFRPVPGETYLARRNRLAKALGLPEKTG